jgi:hypothetical protein
MITLGQLNPHVVVSSAVTSDISESLPIATHLAGVFCSPESERPFSPVGCGWET